MQRLAGNWEFFARYEMRPVTKFVPNLAALRESKVPLVFAGGRESRSYYYCRAGEALAARLGVDFVEFPGHHMAYLDDSDSFAPILRPLSMPMRDWSKRGRIVDRCRLLVGVAVSKHPRSPRLP